MYFQKAPLEVNFYLFRVNGYWNANLATERGEFPSSMGDAEIVKSQLSFHLSPDFNQVFAYCLNPYALRVGVGEISGDHDLVDGDKNVA